MVKVILGEMATDEYPQMMMHIAFPDGTSRRVIGEITEPEDFLVMVQCIGQQRILPEDISLALVRRENYGSDDD